MPTLKLLREKDWTNDVLRDYLVMIDGKEVAQIANGSELVVEVEQGTHQLKLKIDWCGSNEISFDIKNDETLVFECGSSLKGFRWFFHVFYYALFKPNGYLFVRQRQSL